MNQGSKLSLNSEMKDCVSLHDAATNKFDKFTSAYWADFVCNSCLKPACVATKLCYGLLIC